MRNLILIAMLSVVMTGCNIFNPAGGDEFACPGMPNGAVCKTPREVYEATNHEGAKDGSAASNMPMYVFASTPDTDALNPVPVLEQATVMRIWIAPWVDKNKDLHWPGLVFTQIQPRQWHVGYEEMDGVEPPVPRKMYDSAPAVPARPGSSNGSAAMPKYEDEVLN